VAPDGPVPSVGLLSAGNPGGEVRRWADVIKPQGRDRRLHSRAVPENQGTKAT